MSKVDEYDAFVGLDASYAKKAVHWQDLCFIGRKQNPKHFFSAKQIKNVSCKRCLKILGKQLGQDQSGEGKK
jgi:hypothetical protein